MKLIVDYSHVHRPVTGIERVSLDLFGPQALRAFDADYVRAKTTPGMMFAQWVVLPLRALVCRRALTLCPGFPPSAPLTFLVGRRLVAYIHDLFLMTRPHDLNFRAKHYMRPSFLVAVRRGRNFLVNSLYTQDELRKVCRKDARIHIMRPQVDNVFGLDSSRRAALPSGDALKIVSIGTVEPRKDYPYAVAVCQELRKQTGRKVELHIVGRMGWGEESRALSSEDFVTAHGYCTAEQVKDLLESADLFMSTAKEEGVGLPLLEAQYAGIAVAATDIPVFREVLGESGLLLPVRDAAAAAKVLVEALAKDGWRGLHGRSALANVARWNALARSDAAAFPAWLESVAGRGKEG